MIHWYVHFKVFNLKKLSILHTTEKFEFKNRAVLRGREGTRQFYPKHF